MKLLLAISLLAISAEAQSPNGKIRVFVADSETWQASSFNVAGASGAARVASAFGASQAGVAKFTVAVMAQLYKQCPEVQMTNKEASADYFVRLDQDMGRLLIHQDLAVFNKAGELMFAASEKTIARDVTKLCAIPEFGGLAPKRKKK